jgi:hypothetical protein
VVLSVLLGDPAVLGVRVGLDVLDALGALEVQVVVLDAPPVPPSAASSWACPTSWVPGGSGGAPSRHALAASTAERPAASARMTVLRATPSRSAIVAKSRPCSRSRRIRASRSGVSRDARRGPLGAGVSAAVPPPAYAVR